MNGKTAAKPFRVLDSDGHVSEKKIDWKERLSADLRDIGPRFIDELHVFVEGKILPDKRDFIGEQTHGEIRTTKDSRYWSHRDGEWNSAARLDDMDEEGIDVAVLFGAYLSLITVSGLQNKRLAAELSVAYNDWLAKEYCAVSPRRLKGVSVLPMQDVSAAVAEVQRAAKLGMVGVQTFPHIMRKPLHDTSYDPVWAAAQDANLPVCVHIVNTMAAGVDLFPMLGLKHVFIPVDLMCSVASFTAAGILERFPKLKVGFFEGGTGWLPWLASSMDSHVKKLRQEFPWATRLPSEWMSGGNCFFSFEAEDEKVTSAMEVVGSEHLMYASDYCHWDCECPETVRQLVQREDIAENIKPRLAWDNAASFYGITD